MRRDEVRLFIPLVHPLLLPGHRLAVAVFLYPKSQLRRYPPLQALFLDPVIILSHYLFPYVFKVRQMVPSLRGGASPSFVNVATPLYIVPSLNSPQ